MSAAPASHPCGFCPYRLDVPSGIWAEEEYAKLLGYDRETPFQPTGAFFCHRQDGRLCAGWVGCHDMDESLGLRLAAGTGLLSAQEVEAARAYESPVPLFASGAAAAKHGLAEVAAPSCRARRIITKLSNDLAGDRIPAA